GHVGLALTNHRQVKSLADLEHFVGLPLAILPGIDAAGELPEIDFRIKVSSKPFAMAARIDIDDIDGLYFINIIICRKARIGIDHAWIKANSENGGNAFLLAFLQVFPFIIAIPWWRLA